MPISDKNTPIGPKTASTSDDVRDIIADNTSKSPEKVTVAARIARSDDYEEYPNIGESNAEAGCVDVVVEHLRTMLLGITVSADTVSKANAYPENQRFHVTMGAQLYDKLKKGKLFDDIRDDELYTTTAVPVSTLVNEVEEVNVPDPVSPLSKINNFFAGNKPTFTQSHEALLGQCELNPPKTLAAYIARMKTKTPDKLRLIPPAAQIKQGRFNKNIYEGPVVECKLDGGVIIKTDNGGGIKAEGNTTVLSGTVIHDSNDERYPQQLTGIPTQPMPLDDFIPKGNVVMPHVKRAPAILVFIQALLPITEAADLFIKMGKSLKYWKAGGL